MRLNGDMRGYKNIVAWRKGKELTSVILQMADQARGIGARTLLEQMSRSALSIPSNIAEGYRKNSFKGKRHAYTIAFGSASELETQLEILKDHQSFKHENFEPIFELLGHVLRLLNTMVQHPF